ncbi:GDSL esterase/lipase [Hibiscus syriacus]|uniref:GDSL esterase/lipase n=1 Tax=Hibiscus syriacus TaxID=106335 RepID=A0A6A2XDJ6_HIBSY|nr:GDSL esterase/lipase [Hibiscus syriacus]
MEKWYGMVLGFEFELCVRAELLGFDDYIPPYSTASGRQILGGVKYASAASGIREETGQQLGARISFSGQVNYQQTVSQVVDLLGDEDTAADYLSKQYSPQEYADTLIKEYTDQLQALYDYGARKFVLIGLGQIECSPNELAQNSGDGRTCVERITAANRIFNNKLRVLVNEFNNANSDAKFIYINAMGFSKTSPAAPQLMGVVEWGGTTGRLHACLSKLRARIGMSTCLGCFSSREASNVIIGRRSYSAWSHTDAYPIDTPSCAAMKVKVDGVSDGWYYR